MPGLSAIYNPAGYDQSAFTAAIRGTPLERPTIDRFTIDSTSSLGYCSYSEYPLKVAENENYMAILEGRVYQSDAPTQRNLFDLREFLFEPIDHELISDWVTSADGEFLLAFVDKHSGELVVLNDWRAALPTYYSTDNGLVISREIKTLRRYLAEVGGAKTLDRLGIAQLLLFRYTLGDRTIYDNVKRLPPGSLIRANRDGVTVDSTHDLNFGSKHRSTKSVETNATELSTLFTKACRRRVVKGNKGHNLVSLSGGLDSRAIAGVFAGNNDPFTAVTHTLTTADDVHIAKEIASKLDAPWECYQIQDSNRARLKVLSMKQGMLPLGASGGYNYYRELPNSHNRASVLFNGGGGDKALPDLRSSRGMHNGLVQNIIETQSLVDLDLVADIAQISSKQIVDSIRSQIESYPESDDQAKREHYLIRERGINWLGDSADMQRYHLWLATPFYGKKFFEEAMACPPEQKANQQLQAAFLSSIIPQLSLIRDENTGAVVKPGRSNSTGVKHHARQFFNGRPYLRASAKKMLSTLGLRQEQSHPTDIAEQIGEQIRRQPTITQHLSERAIKEFVRTANQQTESSQQNLFTITSLLAASDGTTQ